MDASPWNRLAQPQQIDAAELDLRQRGVAEGHIVAWLSHNRWEMLAALAACQRIGAVLMPLNWRLAAPELIRLLEHAGASHLIHWPETADLALQILSRTTLRDGTAQGIEAGDLLLVYTSGTTGSPKGALHTQEAMLANVRAAVDAQGLNATGRVLAVLPCFHMGGLCIQLLPALMCGAEVLLHPRFDPQAWFSAVEQWRPTTCLLVPAVMKALLDHPRWASANLSSLSFITAGSQIVPEPLIEAFHRRGIPVAQVYGATETGPVSIVLPPNQAMYSVGRTGIPALGVQVQLDSNGEILLRGANLMRAYHRHIEPSFDTQGWFRTGDLAIQHADGQYEVVGRSKDLIISGGENIHPAEIESLLQSLPGIDECAVVGLPDDKWGEIPVLAVVEVPGEPLPVQSIVAACDGRIARFKLPRRLYRCPGFPKTALGKVQRQQLISQLCEQAEWSPIRID